LHSLQRALEHDAPYELEFRAIRPDGQIIWLFTNAMILRNGGEPFRMLGATMDITQRKLAEETVLRLLHISERLNSTLDVDTLLDVLVGEAIGLLTARAAFPAFIPRREWFAASIYTKANRSHSIIAGGQQKDCRGTSSTRNCPT
jgi:hypothetical protein